MGTRDEAEKFPPQIKVGLAAQEKLAKSEKPRDMQDGGRSKVVQLEAVVLQETSEERVDWKPDASY